MCPSRAIPESLYDAALRVITRDQHSDDAQRLEAWHEAQTRLTLREIALEVIKQASERGLVSET